MGALLATIMLVTAIAAVTNTIIHPRCEHGRALEPNIVAEEFSRRYLCTRGGTRLVRAVPTVAEIIVHLTRRQRLIAIADERIVREECPPGIHWDTTDADHSFAGRLCCRKAAAEETPR